MYKLFSSSKDLRLGRRTDGKAHKALENPIVRLRKGTETTLALH
jgi:hypothetical protein